MQNNGVRLSLCEFSSDVETCTITNERDGDIGFWWKVSETNHLFLKPSRGIIAKNKSLEVLLRKDKMTGPLPISVKMLLQVVDVEEGTETVDREQFISNPKIDKFFIPVSESASIPNTELIYNMQNTENSLNWDLPIPYEMFLSSSEPSIIPLDVGPLHVFNFSVSKAEDSQYMSISLKLVAGPPALLNVSTQLLQPVEGDDFIVFNDLNTIRLRFTEWSDSYQSFLSVSDVTSCLHDCATASGILSCVSLRVSIKILIDSGRKSVNGNSSPSRTRS